MTATPSLVELTTLAEFEAETLAMHHAVKHYFNAFASNGTKVFSFCQDGHRVLTLSAPSDGIVRHVVGQHNRPPSPDELATLAPLLTAIGLQLEYTPNLIA